MQKTITWLLTRVDKTTGQIQADVLCDTVCNYISTELRKNGHWNAYIPRYKVIILYDIFFTLRCIRYIDSNSISYDIGSVVQCTELDKFVFDLKDPTIIQKICDILPKHNKRIPILTAFVYYCYFIPLLAIVVLLMITSAKFKQ